MQKERFNFTARRNEWPRLRETIAEMAQLHIGIMMLHDHTSFSSHGETFHFTKEEKPVLDATVSFLHYGHRMRLDALRIAEHFMRAQDPQQEWDSVSFGREKEVLSREEMSDREKIPKIYKYAALGLRTSLARIKETIPPERMLDEAFHAILANTAIIEFHDPNAKPMTNEDLAVMIQETLQAARLER